MSGVFSSVVNFTTEQFLKRAGKLSVLTDIQNQSESGDDNTFTVKPGCRSNIRYLYQLLSQKHEEHLKKITHKSKGNKRSQLSQNNDTTTNLSQDPSETSPTSATHQQYTGTLG
ncbi:unnamed protein product [Rotaria sordida]|uniref:Uncharacterized protein n=2 Tax=Rotaria sordida TaxID=392033 RepID=A0A814NV66_9BILA|nr:unnamed protein product [Rotaria sordida]